MPMRLRIMAELHGFTVERVLGRTTRTGAGLFVCTCQGFTFLLKSANDGEMTICDFLSKHVFGNNVVQIYCTMTKKMLTRSKDRHNGRYMKVDLPLDIDEPFLFCKSTKKRLKVFEFINTRLDHVDLNEFVLNEPIKNVSRDELYELKEELDFRCQYYIYKKDIRGLSSITSFQGKYTINNEYSTTKNEFEEKVGLTHCKIDDIADTELSTFIKCGTHYNSTVDFKDTYPFEEKLKHKVKHIDMSKAYANFHKCKWYEGFMGNITDFRKTNKIITNGLYLVSEFDFKKADKKLVMYNDILRVYHNNNIYGSPELKMLSAFGVKYTIKAGCWVLNLLTLSLVTQC